MEDTMERSEGVVKIIKEDYVKFHMTGDESAIVGTGKNAELELRGRASVGISLDDHAFIYNTGYYFDSSIMACTGEGSVAKNTGTNSIAGATAEISLAKATEDYSVAITTGKKSNSFANGKHSLAAATGFGSSSTQDGSLGGVAVITETGGTAKVGKKCRFGIAASPAVNTKTEIDCREGAAVTTGVSGYAETNDDASSSVALAAGWDSHAAAKGKNNLAIAAGLGAAAKGEIGNWLVLVERDFSGKILDVKTVKVDGKKILPDTYYILKRKKVVKVKE